MRSTTVHFAVIAAFLSFCTFIVAAEDSKTDLRALDGTWDVVSIEVAGRKVEVGKGSPDKIVIKDGKLTIWAQEKPFAIFKDGELELDSKKTPKEIDIVLPDGLRIPGIYELKDKELKIVIPKAPNSPDESLARPQSFDTKGKAVLLLITHMSKK
jgi:uncharacterized protein (TIGR03067 family)